MRRHLLPVALVLLSSLVPACAHSSVPPVASPAEVTSVILVELEKLLDTYSQDEILRARFSGNEDWEREAHIYWSHLYHMLIAANQAYQLVVELDRANEDNVDERMNAVSCYALSVKDLVISLVGRRFYVPGFIKKFAEKASGLEESQCQ